eukprot:464503-Rhodomonas_salina.1
METLALSVCLLHEQPRPPSNDSGDDVQVLLPSAAAGEAEARPAKLPRRDGDGVSVITDAFVRAIEERLDDNCNCHGEDLVTDTAAVARISHTHPALVQLCNHNNNPHTLSLLICRAITFEFT